MTKHRTGGRKSNSALAAHQADLLFAALLYVLSTDFLCFIEKVFCTLNPSRRFLQNWHVELLAFWCEEVRLGRNTRLIANLPPRHLKSLIFSVAFPAYVLGHDPTKRLIVVTYGSEFAVKLANDFRAIVNALWYQALFPGTRISEMKNTETEVVTTEGGYRLAASIGGTLTGRGGDVIIIDDPLKVADALSDSKREQVNEWFYNTLISRLDSKETGAIIVVMQRLHVDDLTGRLLRNPGSWTHLNVPAIAEQDESIQIGANRYHYRRVDDALHPERESLSTLEQLRSQMGPETFAAQYQQCPLKPGGNMIKRNQVRYFDVLPTSYSYVIQSWDTASKIAEENDWSVCTTWRIYNREFYLLDVLRDRFDYTDLKQRAISLGQAYRPSKILIEDSGVGTALISELKKLGLAAIAIKPEQDKKTRMWIQSEKFKNGLVFFRNHAPWLPDLEPEVFAFPYGRHDDQIDSISQALAHGCPSYQEWTDEHTKNFNKFLAGFWNPMPWS